MASLDDVTFKGVLPHVKVFARVSPKQKVSIVHVSRVLNVLIFRNKLLFHCVTLVTIR